MGHWSYWEKSVFAGKRDVIVIGAGITGLNAAYFLKKQSPNLKVIVLERGILPSGASTKNAGFACFGSLSELIADSESIGEDKMLAIVEKRWLGLNMLRESLGDQALDYHGHGGFEIFTEKDQKTYEKCLEKLSGYNKRLREIIGENVFADESAQISNLGLTNVSGLIKNKYEGQIDTGKMMMALMQKCLAIGVEVRFGMEVESIEGEKVRTKSNLDFEGEKIIVATNGFAKQLLDLPLSPARAQVMITKPIKDLKVYGSFHYDQGYYYFRNIHDRLLIGGGRNIDFKSEETTEMDLSQKIQDSIKQVIDEHILENVDYEIDYAWSGIMGVGQDKNPIIEKVNANTYVAVKLGGMGVAIGTLVGKEVAEMVASD